MDRITRHLIALLAIVAVVTALVAAVSIVVVRAKLLVYFKKRSQ